MKITNILTPICLLIASCSGGRMEQHGVAASADLAIEEMAVPNMGGESIQSRSSRPVGEPEKTGEATPVQNEVKIIRTGNISIESKNISESKSNLDQLIKRLGGYYEQENTTTGNGYTSFDLTVRIPQNSFDSLITDIEGGKDKVTNKSVRADDVSLQYYDLESRLKSKRAYLDRYQKMVASAKSVKELLEIEEQIRQLQEEIDSTEATLRNLSGQIQYSTMQVSLFEYQANLPSGSNSFWVRTKEAFAFGWNLIENIALGIIGVWPIMLITVVGATAWRGYKKRKRG